MSHDPSTYDVALVLRTLLESLPPGRALDLGTGLGRNPRALAARGWTVDAVDLSRAQLERARDRTVSRDHDGVGQQAGEIAWILADVDSYAFPGDAYDLVTISFLDVRDRLPAIQSTLASGGILFYEHYLESPAGYRGSDSDADHRPGPGDHYRFAPNELLEACRDLRVLYYHESLVDGEPRVTLVARDDADGSRPPLELVSGGGLE
ncbi:class I SAM-dependent methyltransferase [Natrarchaeobaculum aegyptiacum]|uniref:class I SAM-dependent methyltransferase n=1 Tax=Natrarchaeobaculum aegyptiacum TaxID=745377 RepID=UPI001E53498D|nr:class I SAM-dependent methyltransferase [Natrarchaeobaculum aegyptiacum]